MKSLITNFAIVFILFISCGGNALERKLKPYNPEKAGATIIESFDITEQTNISSFLFVTDASGAFARRIRYDAAEYNNALYLKNSDIIYVFDKLTFTKKDEINLNISTGFRGLAITAEGDAFLLADPELYSLELKTGVMTLIDYPAIDGIDVSSSSKIGYDMARNLIWLEISPHYSPSYLFFTYKEEDGFTFVERKNTLPNVNTTSLRPIGSINENIYLFNGYGGRDKFSRMIDIGIVMRNLDNPEEIEHFIDVEYLNTLIIPRSAHYDGKHIWLLVERKGRILMLKLLPHW